MSLYQLHRAIFDYLRAGEVSSGGAPDFDVSRYDLSEEERKVFEAKDIAALYHLGLHPVLLNSYCRAVGYGRDDYRAILGAHAVPETRTGRWHKDSVLCQVRVRQRTCCGCWPFTCTVLAFMLALSRSRCGPRRSRAPSGSGQRSLVARAGPQKPAFLRQQHRRHRVHGQVVMPLLEDGAVYRLDPHPVTEPVNPVGPGVTLANWRTAQFLRWSFQHSREFLPTARVARGGAVAELPGAPGSLANVPVTDGNGAATTVGAVIASTYTDGFLILHHGRVIMEEYLAGMTASTVHAVMSVTKSVVGCVAAVLAGRGILDPAAPLTGYVPELAGSGYAGATVRHVLDMRSGIIFSEDYLNPRSEIRRLEQCIGWSPLTEAGMPASIYDLLLTLVQGSAHGGPFAYRSCETDVLGWVCERAAGTRMPELMSGLVWSRLGAEHDADISLDRTGVAVHDGGMSTALRDLARFGQMLADQGRSMTGQQVLPAWWVRDTLTGDPDSRDAFAASLTDTRMPGGMYRNTFWVPYPGSAVLLCLGIHGQMVYISTAANVVGVKQSSWPVPQDPVMLASTLRAFDAIAAHLAASGSPQR